MADRPGHDRGDTGLDYWLRDPLVGAVDLMLLPLLRALGVDACSDLGAWFGVTFAALMRGFPRREGEDRIRTNWRALRPDAAGAAETERAVRTWRQMGRSVTEFAVLHRLWPEGRIRVEGAEQLAAAVASGRPVLAMGLHLGNWEILGPTMVALGHPCDMLYQPPENRFDHAIAVAARARSGMGLIYPWPHGFGALRSALESKAKVVLVYADDFIRGRVNAPLWERSTPPQGNLVHIARLAVLTGAAVIPVHAVREGGARFRVVFRPPVDLTAQATEGARFEADVLRLNAAIEPVVRKHLSQWYWLPNLAVHDPARDAPDPLGGRLMDGPKRRQA